MNTTASISHPSVAVHIVTWNSVAHIRTCLESLLAQAWPQLEILIIDNASVDGTMAVIDEHFPMVHKLRNTRNVGYCRAHNQALQLTKSEYVLVMNADVILTSGWLQRGVAYLGSHPEAASFGGKLRRYAYSQDELKEVVQSRILDSTGLQVNRQRYAFDRGSGQDDSGQYQTAGHVFGFSGACVLYRRAALDSVAYRDEVFDQDMFAYKEDVDLSWRLQRRGWSAWYDPDALAYHHRQIKGVSAASDRLIARNHRSRNRFNSYYSYRNHWLMLMKNETWATLWRDAPWIAWFELKKFFFLTFTGQPSFSALGSAFRLSPLMRRKAMLIQHHAKRSALDTRRWFLNASD